jgi:hypothetical protein
MPSQLWVSNLQNVRKWGCAKQAGSPTSARIKRACPSPPKERRLQSYSMEILCRIEMANVLEKEGVNLASNQLECSLLRQLPKTSGLLEECKNGDIALLACTLFANPC